MEGSKMETDENAPPSKDEKLTQGSLLSPFGLLAGVRAMLSTSMKENTSEGSDSASSPSRPVLRDMNTSGSQKSRNCPPMAQGPGVADPGGLPADTASHLSPCWSERGERTSVTSESSFVSAFSTDVNASLPDITQVSSPNRLNGIESDTDTSTAYESAGETEASTSSVDGLFPVSDKEILLNYPIAVSSPFEGDVVVSESDNFKLGNHGNKPTTLSYNLNETIQLEDSAENCPGNVSVSFLTEHLESLSLSTPLKKIGADSSGKAHITLDSDVSGDISSPGLNDSILSCGSVVRECLDSTVTLVDEEEEANVAEEPSQVQNLNETVNISSGSSKNQDIFEPAPPQESHKSENSHPVIYVPSSSDLPNVAVTSPDVEETSGKRLLEPLSEPLFYDSSLDESRLLEELCNKSYHHPEELQDLPSSDASSDKNTTVSLNDIVVEVSPKPQIVKFNVSPANEINSKSDTVYPEIITESVVAKTDGEPALSLIEAKNTTEVADLTGSERLDRKSGTDIIEEPEGTGVCESPDNFSEDSTNSQTTLPSFEDAPLPVKTAHSFDETFPEQLEAEGLSPEAEIDQSSPVKSFDEAPLPVKTHRTFEEILAEQLGTGELPLKSEEKCAKEQFEAEPNANAPICEEVVEPVSEEHPQPIHTEEDCKTVDVETHHVDLDDVPIPIRAPRTFEEILAAELAAQGDPENAVPSFSAEEVPILSKAPRTFEEILAAELAAQGDPEQAVPSFSSPPKAKPSHEKLDESFAQIISSGTAPLESELEPELISDAVLEDVEHVNSLDSLIEKCKQQELDLEQADPNVECIIPQTRTHCLSVAQNPGSTSSHEDVSFQSSCNETVIEASKAHDTSDVFLSESRLSLEASKDQFVFKEPQFCDPTAGINLDFEEFQSGDAFKDPGAFDFLSLHGSSRSARDLRKESLYVKFDPLVGSLISDTRSDNSFTMHPENGTENQNGAAVADDGLQPSEPQLNTSDKLVSLSPAAASKQAEVGAPSTPVKSGSVKSTPVKTPAHVMLNETLESIGSRCSTIKQDELIKKLQEHQTVLAEQDRVYQEHIADLEQRLREKEIEIKDKDKQLYELKDKHKLVDDKDKQLEEKTQSISELRVVMKEYEQTIARIVAEKSQLKSAYEEGQAELIRDRDEAQQHLNNMEMTFADIHKKYERLKSVVEAFKKNEESLNAALAEKKESIAKVQNMYDMLKSHAVQKLEKANQDLEALKLKHQQENAKLRAIIKKFEIKTKSFEEALEQKDKENKALTAICDELINKVGD